MSYFPSTNKISLLSPAKINLFLHITGKRADGYHNLQTVFGRLNFGDTLHFLTDDIDGKGVATSNPFIRLSCTHLTQDINDNLIVKAGNALLSFAYQHAIGKPTPVHIIVDKKIPTGAGLGGGSSNAGTTLLMLNRIWQLNLDTPTLINIAKTLGADVAFFMINASYAIGEGIGDILTAIDLPKLRFLLLFPNCHNSTQSFFADPSLPKNQPPFSVSELIARQDDYLYQLNSPFFNAFQAIALKNPAIFAAHHYLQSLKSGSVPRLTGTGSTVFLPILDDIDGQALQIWQNNAPCPSLIAETY